ncbi:MAG: hypothetical protein CL823_03485 [Crocinitomicaceae bacterium]|nr:hypothetical protein [Crocinitomicaceae bacterium]
MKSNLKLLTLLILSTLVVGCLWIFDKNAENLANDKEAQFAIADTSEVVKIFIADNYGEVVLERNKGDEYFTVNGEFTARKSSTDLLLKTFSRATIKAPVDEKKRENVIRTLGASSRKVEIYTGEGELEKTWYVGSSTPSHTGTYMVLETPEHGMASEPFVVHMEGFTGFLTTRFFTDLDEWKYTGIFNYRNRSLAEVEVINHNETYNSYSIRTDSTGVIKLFNIKGDEIGIDNRIHIQDQFNRFRKVHFESFNSRLTVDQEKDLIANGEASYTITCMDKEGASTTVILFDKDEEHMYGLTEDGQVVLVQTFVFNPLTIGLLDLVQIN